MGKKLDRKVQKLKVRSKLRNQSLKHNPPAKGLKNTLEAQNAPILNRLLAEIKAKAA